MIFGSCKSYAGKKREDVENFINEGIYKVEKLKEEGLITNIHYDDQVELSDANAVCC